nr:hypothetical protein [Nitrosomonas nitrosa]
MGGTTGSAILATTALGVALVLAQYAAPRICEKPAGTIRLAGTEGTLARPHSLEINELDVFKQINRIYDNLLVNQVELDNDSKLALYSDLWDLYSE